MKQIIYLKLVYNIYISSQLQQVAGKISRFNFPALNYFYISNMVLTD